MAKTKKLSNICMQIFSPNYSMPLCCRHDNFQGAEVFILMRMNLTFFSTFIFFQVKYFLNMLECFMFFPSEV